MQEIEIQKARLANEGVKYFIDTSDFDMDNLFRIVVTDATYGVKRGTIIKSSTVTQGIDQLYNKVLGNKKI